MPVNLTPEHHSERALIAEANDINGLGRATDDAMRDAARKAEDRAAYDKKHADLLALPASVIVKYYIYFIALTAVYFLDLALFGPTSEYWVMLATQAPMVVAFAKFIAPLCFLAAEVLISLKIERVRGDVEDAEARGKGHALQPLRRSRRHVALVACRLAVGGNTPYERA